METYKSLIFVVGFISVYFLILIIIEKFKEKTPAGHWNYRVATRIVKVNLNENYIREYREFLFISAYYTFGILNSYGESNVTGGYEEIEGMKWTNKKLAEAFKKEIIDLDNFPNIYKQT